jgi:hypothetical protein
MRAACKKKSNCKEKFSEFSGKIPASEFSGEIPADFLLSSV